MRVLLVNVGLCNGSTGKICINIAEHMERKGHTCKIAYGRKCIVSEQYKKYAVRIGNNFDVYWHGLMTRLFDKHGLASVSATKKFLEWADEYNPDMLWLHNIHGYYINYELLFAWIKSRPNMQVRWTLHDCWAFTGHCSHYTLARCQKWKSGCYSCVNKKLYPNSFLKDNSEDNFARKKQAFCGVKNMLLITPSKWLADEVKQSFLKDYPVVVYNNKIDRNVFKPTSSDFREKYGLVGKKVVLGVASVWGKSKGYDDFLQLRNILDDRYVVVMVGVSKGQMKQLPRGIIGIQRTSNQVELAQIYTTSDVFVNFTYEDNYPTVNLEAVACETPVITYDSGGSGESAKPENILQPGDLDGVVKRIKEICRS